MKIMNKKKFIHISVISFPPEWQSFEWKYVNSKVYKESRSAVKEGWGGLMALPLKKKICAASLSLVRN